MAAGKIAQCGYRRIGLAIEKYQDHIADGRWSFGYAGLSVTMPSLARPAAPANADEQPTYSWAGSTSTRSTAF